MEGINHRLECPTREGAEPREATQTDWLPLSGRNVRWLRCEYCGRAALYQDTEGDASHDQQ